MGQDSLWIVLSDFLDFLGISAGTYISPVAAVVVSLAVVYVTLRGLGLVLSKLKG